MSLNKSATRRLSLLAGSSIVAATLTVATSFGVLMAPAVAFAADECTPGAGTLGNGAGPISDDPTLNGTAADIFNCTAGSYPGVDYTSEGDLTVTSGEMIVGAGLNLTGEGADNVTFTQTGGNYVYTSTAADAVLELTSESGDIEVSANLIWDDSGSTGYGVLATSTGGGDIAISANYAYIPGSDAAISAVTNGGDIDITASTYVVSRRRGILAQTGGAGSVSLTIGGVVQALSADAIVGIDVTAGTGGVNITKTGGSVSAESGLAMRIVSAGAVVIDNTGGSIGEAVFGVVQDAGAVDFSGVTAGGVTFNNSGTGVWGISGTSTFSGFNDTLTMSGTETNLMRDGAVVNFGAGNDTFTLSNALTAETGALNFGTGTDTFNVGGVLKADSLTISGLEALNLSGVIYLGGLSGAAVPVAEADEILAAQGATLTGSGNGRIVMDVDIGAGRQDGCATLTGVGDCVDLRGGATAGVTILTVNNIGPAALLGGYDLVGITIVDVGGGTSAQGHFVLDPNTANLTSDPLYGEVIDRAGLFSTVLRYDAETQRHKLVTLPHGEVMEYAMLSGAAQSVWHMTADTVTDRQTELRDGTDATGLWLRTTGEYSKRRSASSYEGVNQTYTVDTSYKLYAGTIIGGMDLVSGSSGEMDYVLGAQIGYVSSSFDLDNAESSGRMTGATGGAYASLWSDWFFLDGAVNFNGLTLDHKSPVLDASTNTYLNSVGARLDAGTRTSITENTFAEPLLAVSWVRTSFEEISVFGGEIRPADAESLRAGLGLRLGATLARETVSASYYVAGRGWYEFEGESSGVINNPGDDLPFADEFTGAFGEAELGVNVFNAANTLSAFAATGVKWQDGYSAVNLSLGVRMAW